MLKITKTSQHTHTSYLATTMEQDAALCHGFVKKFLPDQMFLLGNPAGAFFKLTDLLQCAPATVKLHELRESVSAGPHFPP